MINASASGDAVNPFNVNVGTAITVNGNTIYQDNGGGIYTYFGTNTITNNTQVTTKAILTTQ